MNSAQNDIDRDTAVALRIVENAFNHPGMEERGDALANSAALRDMAPWHKSDAYLRYASDMIRLALKDGIITRIEATPEIILFVAYAVANNVREYQA